MGNEIKNSIMCYARLQKILKATNPSSDIVVNEENFAKIAGNLLLQTVREESFESFQADFFQIAKYIADDYNATQAPGKGEMLEGLAQKIYGSVKDKNIDMFFLGGLAINMHARTVAPNPDQLVYRTSGDIDLRVDETKLTEFLTIMHKTLGLKTVEDKRTLPPEERHIERFTTRGSPRSGPLVVMRMEDGLGIEIFPMRVDEEGKIYDVGYFPQNGSPTAFTRLNNYTIHNSGNENDPPHTDVVSAFLKKCEISRPTGKDFVDAYNLVASGCVNAQTLEEGIGLIEKSPWTASQNPIDNHSEDAPQEVVDFQENNMGFGFNDKLKEISQTETETHDTSSMSTDSHSLGLE